MTPRGTPSLLTPALLLLAAEMPEADAFLFAGDVAVAVVPRPRFPAAAFGCSEMLLLAAAPGPRTAAILQSSSPEFVPVVEVVACCGRFPMGTTERLSPAARDVVEAGVAAIRAPSA